MNHQNLSSFIWSVADLLRGDYKQSDYGKVILPFTVLRHLDCVMESTKEAVLAEHKAKTKTGVNPEPFLIRKAGQSFYNASPMDLHKLLGDPDRIHDNLTTYVEAFSPSVRDIFERFAFHIQVEKLAKAGLLYLVAEKFANIDLHPDKVSNAQMGLVFEKLIRRFAELSNETAGEHFTPREVIRLMVNLLFRGRHRGTDEAERGSHRLRPNGGHGWRAVDRWGVFERAEPEGPAHDVRPGAERRVLFHL